MLRSIQITAVVSIAATGVFMTRCAGPQVSETVAEQPTLNPTFHRTIEVEGLDIFYREAGPEGAPHSCIAISIPPEHESPLRLYHFRRSSHSSTS